MTGLLPARPGSTRRRRFRMAGWVAGAVLLVLALGPVTALGAGPLPGWWPHRFADVLPMTGAGRPTLQPNPFAPGFGLGPHPFGQDDVGHDYFALTLRGLQRSLFVCLVTSVVAALTGVGIGVTAANRGGLVDSALMRLTDLALTLPAIAVAAVLGRYSGELGPALRVPPTLLLGVVLGLLIWMPVARVVRISALQVEASGYVEAARAMGASGWHIVTRHVLPNVSAPALVGTVLIAANAVALESGLSYLGLGVQPPDTSLGSLVNLYQSAVFTRPWLVVIPAAGILLLVLALNAIGDAIEAALDPRARGLDGGGLR